MSSSDIVTDPDTPSTMRKIVGRSTPGDMKSLTLTVPSAVSNSVSSTSESPA
jgi:hypothetical protein